MSILTDATEKYLLPIKLVSAVVLIGAITAYHLYATHKAYDDGKLDAEKLCTKSLDTIKDNRLEAKVQVKDKADSVADKASSATSIFNNSPVTKPVTILKYKAIQCPGISISPTTATILQTPVFTDDYINDINAIIDKANESMAAGVRK